MRNTAKLLAYCQREPEVKNFADCLKPNKFELVIKGVQFLSGYDENSGIVAVS